MTEQGVERSPFDEARSPRWLIPPRAMGEWADLTAALLEVEVPCSADPDLWFSSAYRPDGVEQAAAGCTGCGVRVECLAYAVAAREREGVWGGLTPAERAGVGQAAS